jgi:hypothetical protein
MRRSSALVVVMLPVGILVLEVLPWLACTSSGEAVLTPENSITLTVEAKPVDRLIVTDVAVDALAAYQTSSRVKLPE